MVRSYPKLIPVRISPHFHSVEFDCTCLRESCRETLIDDELIEKLEKLREGLGLPIRVTSGFRCKSTQEDLARSGYETAKGVSQHELGKAADFVCDDMTGAALEDHARDAGFKAVGVGRRFIHVDLRPDKVRRWFYKS